MINLATWRVEGSTRFFFSVTERLLFKEFCLNSMFLVGFSVGDREE